LKCLFDTHTLLWVINDDPHLSKKAKSIYLNDNHEIFISMATIWELSIKISLKKLEIPGDLSEFVSEHVYGNKIEILSIQLPHLYQLQNLSFHHRDPFDRLIISQAIFEHLPIISADSAMDRYPIKRIW
jgi:PIN domain nuclease of toxin-antitoxin system